jgi:hypothetical protein
MGKDCSCHVLMKFAKRGPSCRLSDHQIKSARKSDEIGGVTSTHGGYGRPKVSTEIALLPDACDIGRASSLSLGREAVNKAQVLHQLGWNCVGCDQRWVGLSPVRGCWS